MKKLTRQEKAVVRSYLKMCISKGWLKPTEYEMCRLVDNMYSECREEMEIFIEKEWDKLVQKTYE